jgi:hypothetical protein
MATTAMNMKGLPARIRAALEARRMQIMTAAAGLGGAALVQGASALTINTTEVDESFAVLTDHIVPRMGDLIGSLPGLIIPIVILVVIIMVLFFFPKLLGELLRMLEGAMKMGK